VPRHDFGRRGCTASRPDSNVLPIDTGSGGRLERGVREQSIQTVKWSASSFGGARRLFISHDSISRQRLIASLADCSGIE